MILKLRQRMTQEESGFTLVELLVVMLILGLLAAIAIPAFFNQRNKAKDADAKASVRTAETAMETYNTGNGGSYDGATEAALDKIEPTLTDSPGDTLVISAVTGEDPDKSYEVTVDSTNAGNSFSITRHDDGTTVLSCQVADTDGCPPASAATGTAGDWGAG